MKASTKAMNEYVEKMFNQYGHLYCEKCLQSNVHIDMPHHIIFKSEKPRHKELHNKRNLILLCRDCHNYMHQHKHNEFRIKLIKERNLKDLFGLEYEV